MQGNKVLCTIITTFLQLCDCLKFFKPKNIVVSPGWLLGFWHKWGRSWGLKWVNKTLEQKEQFRVGFSVLFCWVVSSGVRSSGSRWWGRTVKFNLRYLWGMSKQLQTESWGSKSGTQESRPKTYSEKQLPVGDSRNQGVTKITRGELTYSTTLHKQLTWKK